MTPVLETPRLILRPTTLADAPAYQQRFAHWDVVAQLSRAVPWPYPDDGAESFIRFVLAQPERWIWSIFDRSVPTELIGVVDLWRAGVPENRGFWLAQSAWGQGYMTEACERVNEFAFIELGFEKLIFSNAVANTRSRRIKEKTGARFICVRAAEFVDPSLSETETWELTKADWLSHRSR